MHYSAVAAFMILTTIFLSACSQQEVATLEDKSGQYFGRNATAAASFSSAPTVSAASVDAIATQDLTPAPATLAPQAPFQSSFIPSPARGGAPAAATLSWQWPVKGQVATRFGKQRDGIASEGITIAAAKGTPIRAAASGQVAFVGDAVRDYGNMVILRHEGGDMTSYAHAERIAVAKGMTVKQGDVIGYVGQSGSVRSPQLHFAMRSGDRAVDPLSKLPGNIASL